MNSPHTNNRVYGYDLLKALAMFMVVFYHFQMLNFSFEPNTFYFPNFNKIIQLICAAGIPLFFMVNGALTINNKTTFNKVIHKVSRLFLIAFFWTIILRCGVIAILLGRGQPNSIYGFIGNYWFLISLANVYFLNYLIQISPKWVGYLLLIIIFVLTFINNFVWDIILFVNPDHILPRWGHSGLFTLYGLVYSRIGAYLKHKNLNFTICTLIFLLGLALNIFKTIAMTNHYGTVFDGVNASFPTIGALLLGIALFFMLKDVKEPFWSSRLIKTIGLNSCGIYLFHAVFVFMIRDQMKAIFHHNTFPLYVILLLAIGVTILCAYISEGISRTPGRVLLKL